LFCNESIILKHVFTQPEDVDSKKDPSILP